mmetsp:Transcript_115582/g.331817  ORF Transcript_115582/g.331817 Transcript_115582/m.331817 type:complete len:240 (-) Transcript_115582:13-732(-)
MALLRRISTVDDEGNSGSLHDALRHGCEGRVPRVVEMEVAHNNVQRHEEAQKHRQRNMNGQQRKRHRIRETHPAILAGTEVPEDNPHRLQCMQPPRLCMIGQASVRPAAGQKDPEEPIQVAAPRRPPTTGQVGREGGPPEQHGPSDAEGIAEHLREAPREHDDSGQEHVLKAGLGLPPAPDPPFLRRAPLRILRRRLDFRQLEFPDPAKQRVGGGEVHLRRRLRGVRARAPGGRPEAGA